MLDTFLKKKIMSNKAKQIAMHDMAEEGLSLTVFHYGIQLRTLLNSEVEIEALERPIIKRYNGKRVHTTIIEITIGVQE